MPISFSCPNGHPLRVKEEFAGKKAKCPKCGTMMVVPAAVPDEGDGYEVTKDETGHRAAAYTPEHAGNAAVSVSGRDETAEEPRVIRRGRGVEGRVAKKTAATHRDVSPDRRKLILIGASAIAGIGVAVALGFVVVGRMRADRNNAASVAQAPANPLPATDNQPVTSQAGDPTKAATQSSAAEPSKQLTPEERRRDLLSDLASRDSQRRSAAALEFKSLPPRSETARDLAKVLADAVASNDAELLLAVLDALPEWFEKEEVPAEAYEKINQTLLELLRSQNQTQRIQSVRLLATWGNESDVPTIAEFMKLFNRGDRVEMEIEAAVLTLSKIPCDASAAILLQTYKQVSDKDRLAAALGKMGPFAEGPVVHDLNVGRPWSKYDVRVRCQILASLDLPDGPSEETVNTLIELIRPYDEEDRVAFRLLEHRGGHRGRFSRSSRSGATHGAFGDQAARAPAGRSCQKQSDPTTRRDRHAGQHRTA